MSSSSCDKPKRGGGGPTRRLRHGSSNSGDTSRDRFLNARRHRVDDNFHGSRGRRKSAPPHSSLPESLEDWDSEFVVVDDEDRRHREKKERDPRTGRDQEQLRQIRERIVKDGCRNDNGIFARRLDRLPMHLQLSHMRRPDNEPVQLSALYKPCRGVASERIPEQQRSVRQPHEVGTGQCSNPSTPLQRGYRPTAGTVNLQQEAAQVRVTDLDEVKGPTASPDRDPTAWRIAPTMDPVGWGSVEITRDVPRGGGERAHLYAHDPQACRRIGSPNSQCY